MTCSTPPEAARRGECNAPLPRVAPCRVFELEQERETRFELKSDSWSSRAFKLGATSTKCCCVISKGRAFHRPTSHPPAPMGSGRTRKTVAFKSSSNKKPLGPLVQKQSTPQPNQPHGRAQLDMVVLLMWLVWGNAEAICSSWGQDKLHPPPPDVRSTRRCVWPEGDPPDVGLSQYNWP